MRSPRVLVPLGLVAIIVIVLLLPRTRGTARERAGRAAPALPTAVLHPPPVTLASLRGKPVVINFWASWCGPCRKEAPELAALSARLGSRGTLVGVDWSDGLAGARAFIAKYRWRFSVLRDGDGSVGNRYGLTGLPTTFVLDPEGRIARTLRGPQTVARFLGAVRAAEGRTRASDS